MKTLSWSCAPGVKAASCVLALKLTLFFSRSKCAATSLRTLSPKRTGSRPWADSVPLAGLCARCNPVLDLQPRIVILAVVLPHQFGIRRVRNAFDLTLDVVLQAHRVGDHDGQWRAVIGQARHTVGFVAAIARWAGRTRRSERHCGQSSNRGHWHSGRNRCRWRQWRKVLVTGCRCQGGRRHLGRGLGRQRGCGRLLFNSRRNGPGHERAGKCAARKPAVGLPHGQQ